MDRKTEEFFVTNFIIKDKRERTLFELNSTKKREQIIQRLFNYTDKKSAVYYGCKSDEAELLNIIKKHINLNSKCYIIADSDDDGKILNFNEAFKHMLEYGVCYTIICDNKTVIMREEVCYGTPPVCILHNS